MPKPEDLGIEIAPPDINQSGLDFTIEDQEQKQAIRFGLGAIKNAGESALMIVLEERQANGPFEGLQDFCDRVDLRRVGKRTLEYMVKARAFESWGTVPSSSKRLTALWPRAAERTRRPQSGK